MTSADVSDVSGDVMPCRCVHCFFISVHTSKTEQKTNSFLDRNYSLKRYLSVNSPELFFYFSIINNPNPNPNPNPKNNSGKLTDKNRLKLDSFLNYVKCFKDVDIFADIRQLDLMS